jgi:16S rRNA (guanine966-N2)-methyltransferase
VFNSLTSLGVIQGADLLDLFAGSGAMGIEALSRGAARATFVDSDPAACACIRTNLRNVGFGDRAAVVQADVASYLARQPALVDLAVLDPPYRFDGWPTVLAKLDAATLVLESDRPVDPGERWAVVREKRTGSTVVVIAQRRPPPA